MDTTGTLDKHTTALDLYAVQTRLQHKDHGSGWSPERAAAAVLGYRRFLHLILQGHTSLVPSRDIDEVWHQHILDTRAYASDCESVFGRFIHHFPYLGLRDDADREVLRTKFASSTALYESIWHEPYGDAPGCCCEWATVLGLLIGRRSSATRTPVCWTTRPMLGP